MQDYREIEEVAKQLIAYGCPEVEATQRAYNICKAKERQVPAPSHQPPAAGTPIVQPVVPQIVQQSVASPYGRWSDADYDKLVQHARTGAEIDDVRPDFSHIANQTTVKTYYSYTCKIVKDPSFVVDKRRLPERLVQKARMAVTGSAPSLPVSIGSRKGRKEMSDRFSWLAHHELSQVSLLIGSTTTKVEHVWASSKLFDVLVRDRARSANGSIVTIAKAKQRMSRIQDAFNCVRTGVVKPSIQREIQEVKDYLANPNAAIEARAIYLRICGTPWPKP